MKKVLVLLVALLCAVHVSAQEADPSGSQPEVVSVDSLLLRLDKLQHAYDFLSCDHQVSKLSLELKDLLNSIECSSQDVFVKYCFKLYDRALYDSYVNNYESDCALLDSYKEEADAVRLLIFEKVATSGFTENEAGILYLGLSVIEKAITSIQISLNYYQAVIKTYRSGL